MWRPATPNSQRPTPKKLVAAATDCLGSSIYANSRRITMCSRISIGMAAATVCFVLSTTLHAQVFIKGERPQQRGYSLAVITEGGKTVWLGGQIATVDDTGKSLAGDFEGQVRQIFKLI